MNPTVFSMPGSSVLHSTLISFHHRLYGMDYFSSANNTENNFRQKINTTSSRCSYWQGEAGSYLDQTGIIHIGPEPGIQVDLTIMFKCQGNFCNHTSLEILFYNSKFSKNVGNKLHNHKLYLSAVLSKMSFLKEF